MLKVKKSNRLQRYFSLPFGIVGLVSLIMVLTVSVSSSKNILQNIALDITQDNSRRVIDAIKRTREDHQRTFQRLSDQINARPKQNSLELVSFARGLLSTNQSGIKGLFVVHDDFTMTVLSGKTQPEIFFRSSNDLIVSPTQSDIETLSDRMLNQQTGYQVKRNSQRLYLLWSAHFGLAGKSRLALLLSENTLKRKLSELELGRGLNVFVTTEQGWLSDVGLFLGLPLKTQFNAYDHQDCMIRCTARRAFDQWGQLGKLEADKHFTVDIENGSLFASILPIPEHDSYPKFFLFSTLTEFSYVNLIWETLEWSILSCAVVLILFLALGLWASERITTPIRNLSKSVNKIGHGDWNYEIDLERADDIGELSRSFNQMAIRMQELVKNLESRVEERTSDLKNLIEKYSQANKELERTNATKDRFFSIIAHDLKSPFMALKGYSGIIEDSYESLSQEQLRSMINKIAVSSEEAHGLLENLLQWAIMQSGGIRVKWEVFDIQEVILEVFDLMKVNARVKRITLENQVPKDTWVEADRNMISTVFRNIISNSIKFSKPQFGKVIVSARKTEKYIEITLADNGIGIDSENIRKLFAKDIYFTEKGTGDESGTGLGLGLCKEFVSINRGLIDVKSEVGKGSQFLLSLLSAARPHLQNSGSLEKTRILCVDDSEDNHNLIRIFLKTQAWQLDFASHGAEALEILFEREFDVVLMDINMPVLDGIETTRRLREWEDQQGRSRCHVIAFTSSVLQEDIDAAIGAGCDSYLVKPIKKQKLINSISRIMRR